MIKLIKSTFYKEPETKKKLNAFIKKASILSMGSECRKFEENFSRKQNRKFSVFVNSGSSANLILIQSLLNLGRLKKGNKIGVSALTWSTNVMPLIQLGLIPVALDCELKTLNVSPDILMKHINKIDGLFLTNALGFCDKINEIKNICLEKKKILIEDNCESLGSKIGGELLGNFGLASTFSFFVGHHLSTIEGGMVCTDDEELNNSLIMIRAHGWNRNLEGEKQKIIRKQHKRSNFLSKYVFFDLAYNVRPTEINGFLGNSAVKYWEEITQKRSDNFLRWHKKIIRNEELVPLDISHMDFISDFAMPVLAKNKKIFLKYKKRFKESNVEIRPIIAGDITRQPFYRKYVTGQSRCPNARLVEENGFYFGNDPQFSRREVDFLSNLLEKN